VQGIKLTGSARQFDPATNPLHIYPGAGLVRGDGDGYGLTAYAVTITPRLTLIMSPCKAAKPRAAPPARASGAGSQKPRSFFTAALRAKGGTGVSPNP